MLSMNVCFSFSVVNGIFQKLQVRQADQLLAIRPIDVEIVKAAASRIPEEPEHMPMLGPHHLRRPRTPNVWTAIQMVQGPVLSSQNGSENANRQNQSK